jgi:hypothetical protein
MSKRVAFFIIALILIAFLTFSIFALFNYKEPDCYVGLPGCAIFGAILCDWLLDKLDKF